MKTQEITLTFDFNEGDQIITFKGFSSSDITIDTKNDVDFTEFVEKLEFLIENNTIIKFTRPDGLKLNEKVQLVISTIDEIIAAYNESVKMDEVEADETAPKIEKDDDIPF